VRRELSQCRLGSEKRPSASLPAPKLNNLSDRIATANGFNVLPARVRPDLYDIPINLSFWLPRIPIRCLLCCEAGFQNRPAISPVPHTMAGLPEGNLHGSLITASPPPRGSSCIRHTGRTGEPGAAGNYEAVHFHSSSGEHGNSRDWLCHRGARVCLISLTIWRRSHATFHLIP
jgi:hypothetical protein